MTSRILSILNIGILILDVLGVTNLQTTLSQAINIVASLTAILICRFILDLRAIYPNDLSRDGVSHSNASSVRFASAVVGNVGAPLSGCNFLSSAAEVDSQEDSPIYTDEPLQTVLREDSDMETQCAYPSFAHMSRSLKACLV
ncbi:hypothetical protein K474DRAFT_1511480 [Panus rudis PR-1116 ss-1]|nr:hypothetical protein K474DRAFT_1511480 [Panus rudis PR-1116 ss-1]